MNVHAPAHGGKLVARGRPGSGHSQLSAALRATWPVQIEGYRKQGWCAAERPTELIDRRVASGGVGFASVYIRGDGSNFRIQAIVVVEVRTGRSSLACRGSRCDLSSRESPSQVQGPDRDRLRTRAPRAPCAEHAASKALHEQPSRSCGNGESVVSVLSSPRVRGIHCDDFPGGAYGSSMRFCPEPGPIAPVNSTTELDDRHVAGGRTGE